MSVIINNPFRPEYRELTDMEKLNIAKVKDAATKLYAEVQFVGNARYRAMAITALEESVMWAVKGITG